MFIKLAIAFSKTFALFVLGIFLAFPISAMCGVIAIFLSYLSIIWEIFWRGGLSLLLVSAIALTIEGWNNGVKNNL
ncbi:MAG: hypothetical protein LH649_10030 [Pseudanabaena sp. CAN_BIN31]|nr:hypothetical protein [Pseudanabaena sp. CAN_BIN31]